MPCAPTEACAPTETIETRLQNIGRDRSPVCVCSVVGSWVDLGLCGWCAAECGAVDHGGQGGCGAAALLEPFFWAHRFWGAGTRDQ